MCKKWVSRIVAVLMTSVMALSITGCGGGSGQSAPSSSQSSQASQSSPAPAPAKEITINFPCIWVGKDSKANTVQQIIKQFNEENAGKIKVVVEEMSDYQAYRDKMRTNITTGNAPDIFTYDNASVSELYFKSGKLMDITPYMEKGWKNDFLTGSLNEVTYQGKVMAIPFEFGVTPVLYNDRLFKKAGINGFPKTYTEFFDACEKLKAAGIAPSAQMTGENAWTSMLWYSQIVAAIGGIDVYKRGFDDPAFLEAAKVMKKMYQYTTKDAVGAGAAVTAGHFVNERIAIFMNGPWFIGRIKKEGVNNMYDEVKVAPAPAYEGGKGQPGGYIGFTQAYIALGKQSDKAKEEAVIKFVQYLTKPENVKKISIDSGAMFVVKTNFTADDKIDKLQKEMIEQTAKAPYTVPHFNASVKPAVATEFPQALSGLVLGQKTPEQFIEQLKKASAN